MSGEWTRNARLPEEGPDSFAASVGGVVEPGSLMATGNRTQGKMKSNERARDRR